MFENTKKQLKMIYLVPEYTSIKAAAEFKINIFRLSKAEFYMDKSNGKVSPFVNAAPTLGHFGYVVAIACAAVFLSVSGYCLYRRYKRKQLEKADDHY